MNYVKKTGVIVFSIILKKFISFLMWSPICYFLYGARIFYSTRAVAWGEARAQARDPQNPKNEQLYLMASCVFGQNFRKFFSKIITICNYDFSPKYPIFQQNHHFLSLFSSKASIWGASLLLGS
jgi:hypothetical protein